MVHFCSSTNNPDYEGNTSSRMLHIRGDEIIDEIVEENGDIDSLPNFKKEDEWTTHLASVVGHHNFEEKHGSWLLPFCESPSAEGIQEAIEAKFADLKGTDPFDYQCFLADTDAGENDNTSKAVVGAKGKSFHCNQH